MSSFRIFCNRVKRDYVYQYGIIKSVADWTVMLYIIIPFSIAGIMIYRSWWNELPDWSVFLSLKLTVIIAYLLCWTGSLRTFVQEADGLYFIQHTRKFIAMKKWALIFSIVKAFIRIGFIVILILPFYLHKFSLSIGEIISFFCFFIALHILLLSIHTTMFSIRERWSGKIYSALLFVFLFIMIFTQAMKVYELSFSISIAVLLLLLAIVLHRPRVQSTKYFQEEFVQENEAKLRYMNKVFSVSSSVEKPKIIKRKRPIIFPKSKRIFSKRTRENGFIEVFLKVILRNFSYLKGYLQLISVTLMAIILLPPLIFKLFIAGGFVFFIFFWLNNLWNHIILSNPISKQYEKRDSFYHARRRASLYLAFPAILIIVTVLALSYYLF
ncbi:ABC transporter permease [Bacillus massiliigorillae]|uniref:ABC transporter permease n=1 Tax=Bacillus massiliigorillae TaxID=1243664 RepID=UPI0003A21FCF|nr:ABC transporter permease [Bacillus massiliigorillae]